MTNIEIIQLKLLRPNWQILVPMAHKDTKLLLSEWEIQTASVDGTVTNTGTFHSPQSLSEVLGAQLTLIPYVDNKFFMMRYGMDWETVPNVIAFLKSKGMKNMREDSLGKVLDAVNIDYTKLTGNEFGIFPDHMIADIPRTIPSMEVTV